MKEHNDIKTNRHVEISHATTRRRMLYMSSSDTDHKSEKEPDHVTSSRFCPPNNESKSSKELLLAPNAHKVVYQALKELHIFQSCSSFNNSSLSSS